MKTERNDGTSPVPMEGVCVTFSDRRPMPRCISKYVPLVPWAGGFFKNGDVQLLSR